MTSNNQNISSAGVRTAALSAILLTTSASYAMRTANNKPYTNIQTSMPEAPGFNTTYDPVASSGREFPVLSEEETRELFNKFSQEWTRDTLIYSDARMLMHPSYHKILAMGEAALPFIFEELATGDGAVWLPALEAITLGRVNPIKPGHEQNADLMCQDWLDWGIENEFFST